jgi:hypothetical protein
MFKCPLKQLSGMGTGLSDTQQTAVVKRVVCVCDKHQNIRVDQTLPQ